MGFRYKLRDLCCKHCMERSAAKCSVSLCPHIMGNLSDLYKDPKFREAVKNAEKSRTLHRNTLKHLKNKALESGQNFSDDNNSYHSCINEESFFRRNRKPECQKCGYASPGFICFNESDGSCMKDWIRSIENGRS